MWTILITIASSVIATLIVLFLVRQIMPREAKIAHELKHLYGVRDPQFPRSVQHLLPPLMLDGTKVTPLLNGDEIFPAMLQAIRGARKSITFETFVYWSGEIGKEFALALAERSEAGVPVHVLLDWVGSKAMDRDALEIMEQGGVQIERYHKPTLMRLHNLNHRTHRKLLVIDGTTGFTGGVGIAKEWTGHAQDPGHWRDTHFRIEGPIVAELQGAFMDNWLKTHSTVLHDECYFPEIPRCGTVRGQVFKSSPDAGSESVRLLYLLSIACAERSVKIGTAYFVPDDLSVKTIVDACDRGVEVELIVPGEHIDARAVRWASRARWGPLLQAGVKIYEYQPTMYHVKVMVVDGIWTTIGSTNFDNRSFRLNDEANLNLYDEGVAAVSLQQFEEDKNKSRQVTYEMWKNRPLHHKLRERAAELLRSQL